MSFKVINHGGIWIVAKEGAGTVFPGGAKIDYSLYKQLKDSPHNAALHFDLDAQGRPVPIEQKASTSHD